MKVFNQNNYGIGPDCVPTTCMQIIKSMYFIDSKYSLLNRIVIRALQALVLFKVGGAKFETYYNWFIKELNKQTGLNLIIEKENITLYRFRNKSKENYYGLWLKHGNSTYLNALKKGYLTKKDIDNIVKEGGGFNHNNCYGKGTLLEVYTGEEITLPYSVLKYGVEKGVFGSVGRTIVGGKDEGEEENFTKDVLELLITWGNNPKYDPYYKGMTKYETKVMNKAGNLLLHYEYR